MVAELREKWQEIASSQGESEGVCKIAQWRLELNEYESLQVAYLKGEWHIRSRRHDGTPVSYSDWASISAEDAQRAKELGLVNQI